MNPIVALLQGAHALQAIDRQLREVRRLTANRDAASARYESGMERLVKLAATKRKRGLRQLAEEVAAASKEFDAIDRALYEAEINLGRIPNFQRGD